MTWQLSLTGLLVGGLVGLTGMGGGSLMTPILILVFGFKPTYAVGTDILHGAIFKTFGAVLVALSLTRRPLTPAARGVGRQRARDEAPARKQVPELVGLAALRRKVRRAYATHFPPGERP